MRKMKDSGIDWIGMIPYHWTCCKQKYLITLVNGRAYKDDEFEEDGKYKILRVGNLFTNPVWYTSSLELEPKKYCQDGDLLYSWSMSYAPVIWHGEKVIYEYHIWKTILSEKINKMFAYYYLISLTNALQAEVHETTMGFITMGVMNNAYIAFPTVDEQKKIADFLDEKCGEIDSIKADMLRQIELLNDYKKSVITEAVTGRLEERTGFRSTDERREKKWKDSRIPRIGKIPVEWGTSRIKYVCSVIGSGTTPSSGNVLYYEGSENWIQSGDLYKKKYITETEKTVTDYAVSTISALHKYKADFIVIAMYGASIGNVAISKIDACVNQACCVIKPNSKVNFNYLYYTLINDKDIMLDMSIGGTQPNISQAKILELPVLLPPLSEQKAIADYLDEKCSEIDATIADKQRQLETLDEYKKSLIFEYVTGKKEVS